MHRIQSKSEQQYFRIHYEEKQAVWQLSEQFLQSIPFHQQQLAFIFIGTDRSTGDSLGPLTGSILQERTLFPYPVFGTLKSPVHALNLENTVQDIHHQYPSAFIIAIDACLGKPSSVGQILVQEGPLMPGQAVGKKLPPVGDLAVKGVVNVGGFMDHAVLQSTRLHLPFEMSKIITKALQFAHLRAQSEKVQNRYNHAYNENTGY